MVNRIEISLKARNEFSIQDKLNKNVSHLNEDIYDMFNDKNKKIKKN